MDYCFMRTDVGYDAIVLAMEDRQGVFQVYLLGDERQQEEWLFEERDPHKLKARIVNWCKQHLSDDMIMKGIPVKRGQLSYQRTKSYLQQMKVPYEMRQRTFYVRKKEYELYKDKLGLLVK